MKFNTDIKFYESTENLLTELENISGKFVKITDTNIAKFFPNIIDENTLVLGSGETFKNLDSIVQIINFALEKGLTRHDTFIGVGGGVITDMTAFASSIYKRGAKLQLVATTLLAMVDAAIGGKTGCDIAGSKNMIGTFFPAEKLHIASDFVKTLSDFEYLSGLAEVIKTAFLYDEELLELLENNSEKIIARDSSVVNIMIEKCAKAKCKIVSEDLMEKGIRKQLNLGHTFGHALESLCGLGKLSHGEAVAWGIARAAELSYNLKLCSESFKDRCISLLKKYGYETNAKHPMLKMDDSKLDFIKEMQKDKKNIGSSITIILQKDSCKTEILEVPEEEILKVL